MILSRNQIIEKWQNKEIMFEPDIEEDQISICSVNLRVGKTFNKIKRKEGHIINPSLTTADDLYESLTTSNDKIILQKNDFVLAPTYEYLIMPNNLAAMIEGRSTFARYGLSAHITAPFINPGFQGNITLEMYNHADMEIFLEAGKTKICQLIFFEISEAIDPKIVESLSKYRFQKNTTPKPDKL